MTDALKDRTIDCFGALFPNYTRAQLLTASRESIPEWDSLAGVTLLTLLQQEFQLEIDLAELEHFNSVKAVLDYVEAHAGTAEEQRDR